MKPTDVQPARRLCLFVRAPELGRVKSRLAATLGAHAALAAYEQLVVDQLARLDVPASVHRELWWTGTSSDGVADWGARWGAELYRQGFGDLGQRMAETLFAGTTSPRSSPSEPAADSVATLVLGADVVGINPGYLDAAYGWLQDNPAGWVFAPTEDGGYGLVGCQRRCADPSLPLDRTPFRHVPWGTADVMATTRARCRALGLPCYELGTVWDVDEEADWVRYQRRFDSETQR